MTFCGNFNQVQGFNARTSFRGNLTLNPSPRTIERGWRLICDDLVGRFLRNDCLFMVQKVSGVLEAEWPIGTLLTATYASGALGLQVDLCPIRNILPIDRGWGVHDISLPAGNKG